MNTVKLPSVAEIVMGQSPPSSAYNRVGDGLPFFQGKTDFGQMFPTPRMYCDAPKKVAEAGDILISVRAPVGPTNVNPTKSCIGRGLAAIRPKSSLDGTYLLYFLRNHEPDLARLGQGSTFEAIGKRELHDIRIPLPPLAEQQRIADILARADRLRQLRRYALQLSDTYLQAVFLRMFGDPVTNPMGWPIYLVEDLLSKSRVGTRTGPFGSSLKRHEYVASGVPVWQINNVRPNEFVAENPLYITTDKYARLKNYSVERGDVLISRAGTVGRMCVAFPDETPSIIGTNLIRVVLNAEHISPAFFVALFTFFGKSVGRLRRTGDENAYSFLNPSVLKTLRIYKPDRALQGEYVRLARQFERLRTQQREAVRQADHLFDTLLHRAFRGELPSPSPSHREGSAPPPPVGED